MPRSLLRLGVSLSAIRAQGAEPISSILIGFWKKPFMTGITAMSKTAGQQ